MYQYNIIGPSVNKYINDILPPVISPKVIRLVYFITFAILYFCTSAPPPPSKLPLLTTHDYCCKPLQELKIDQSETRIKYL